MPGATATARDAALLKSQRTLDLRMAGATFASIATSLGYADRSNARKAYLKALDAEINLKADERDTWRREQAARCDRLIRALWPQAMGTPERTVNGRTIPASLPDPKAHSAITRHLERQARLLGLDAPVKVQVDDGLTSEIEAMLDEMGRLEREAVTAATEPEQVEA